ncbi:P-loop containing nucleoside triphosphate hydrolase protein [Chlamydoabsidia padenii]|nr:P-loop containing nucleoside triphosphate hydrolase protein [Chlamydoabsidia padenii]
MALISSSIPPPSFTYSPSSSSSTSIKSYIKPNQLRSLSTSLLPRPSTTRPQPSAMQHQPYRRRPSHIPQLKPSISNNSNSLSTSSSQTSKSTSSNSLLVLPHSSTGTRSSPLKMAGQQLANARVLVQCLGTRLHVEDSGAVITLPQSSGGVKTKRKRFIFDHVLGPNESVENFMPSLQPLLRQALYGYSGTILSYGPARCGKSSVRHSSPTSRGIILRSVETLFDLIFKEPDNEYVLRASYYELHEDTLRDLICPSNLDINIRQTKKKNPYVGPLTEEIITSPTDILKIIQKGQANLYLCSDLHAYKDSHVVFQLVVESQKRSNQLKTPHLSGSLGSQPVTTCQVMFVDLADSETPPSSSSSTFTMNQHYPLNRRQKRKDIGLSTFEATVLQLTGKDNKYTPLEWKTSILTRLLEPSLTGQTNLASICTIDDQHHSYDYLKFACRLRKLAVAPKINQETDDQSFLKRHRQDRLKLKSKLAQLNSESDDNQQMIRAALVRQLTYNADQIIAHEKYSSSNILSSSPIDLSPSTSSSSSSSLSSLLAAANFAKAITDKMEQQELQNNEAILIKELNDEKTRLMEQNRSLLQKLTLVEEKVHTLERQQCILDSLPFLEDELRVAKTELEVVKLLVHKP